MTILERIMEQKSREVSERRQAVPIEELMARAASAPRVRSLKDALKPTAGAASAGPGRLAQPPRIIAEVKKASPSKGVIRQDFDPVEIARSYEEAGAAAISVLTDEPFFQGRLQYLEAIRNAVDLPLLRKDFMLHPYQVWEARAAGADAILLIMAAIADDELLKKLAAEAGSLGMDVLWEIHNDEELRRVLPLGPQLLGINNRNLKTFEVTLETTRTLLPQIPSDVVKVSESGFFLRSEIDRMREWGVDGFLIGESLLRADDPGVALAKLLGNTDEVTS